MLAFHIYYVWLWFIVSCVWSKHTGWDCGDGGLFVSEWCPVTFNIQPFTQKYTDQQIALTPIILDYINL